MCSDYHNSQKIITNYIYQYVQWYRLARETNTRERGCAPETFWSLLDLHLIGQPRNRINKPMCLPPYQAVHLNLTRTYKGKIYISHNKSQVLGKEIEFLHKKTVLSNSGWQCKELFKSSESKYQNIAPFKILQAKHYSFEYDNTRKLHAKVIMSRTTHFCITFSYTIFIISLQELPMPSRIKGVIM